MKYNIRYIARIVMEAKTPIAVGSGNKDLTLDRPVAKDANGIPYIPGTSLAGVLRHAIYANVEGDDREEVIKNLNDIFGFPDDKDKEKSLGSRLALSSAHLIGKHGKVFDGLFLIPMNDDNYDFINHYRELPVREHVRLSHKGVADTENKGKFVEEVLYKGSRFIFEMEMKGTDKSKVEDDKIWGQLLNVFSYPDFRIGSGSTRGFGKIKVKKIMHQILDLTKAERRDIYLNHSSCLNSEFSGDPFKTGTKQLSKYVSYQLNLKPEDFYLFSSGLCSDVADMNPVKEQIVEWDVEDEPTFSEELVLIPAASVKGAISHRVAFHYNMLDGNYADKLMEGESLSDYTGENNKAVKALFGSASNYSDNNTGRKGVVRFSDVYRKNVKYKKLDHVAIDRFTGGPIDGALFHENTVRDIVDGDNPFILDFWIQPDFMDEHTSGENGLEEKDHILQAFEETLTDICSGSLPLGGGTMRGNGVFTGILKSNKNGTDEILYTNK